MLRFNVLAVLFLGVLASCSPTEPQALVPADSLGQVRRAAFTTIEVPADSLTWSGSQGTTGTCCTYNGDTSPEYSCGSGAFAVKSFLDPVRSGDVVVKIEARVNGRSVNRDSSVSVKLVSGTSGSATTLVDLGNFTESADACGTTDTSCKPAQTLYSGDGSRAVSGYTYGNTNYVRVAAVTTGVHTPTYCLAQVDIILTVAQPSIALTHGSLDFGNQKVNTTSVGRPLRVSNAGGAPLKITNLSYDSSFVVTDAGVPLTPPTPDSPLIVAAGGYRDLLVKFNPKTVMTTPVNSNLVITSNDPGTSPKSIPISGKGVMFATEVASSPLNFPTQLVGASIKASLPVRLNNVGQTPLTITPVLSGMGATSYRLSSTTVTLAANGSTDLNVTFDPTGDGTFTANLRLSSTESDWSPVDIALTGTGIKPTVSLSATTVDFGNQRVDTTSAARIVRVTNSGSAPLTVSTISISAPFQISSTDAFTLNPGAYTDLSVRFTPTATGAVPTTSRILLTTDDPANRNPTVSLKGTGIKPTVSLSASTLDFGNQRVDTTSAPRIVRLTNSGTDTLTVSTVSISAPFQIPPTAMFSLAPGAFQDFSVTFAPTATGAVPTTSRLLLSTDDRDNPSATVSLKGTGVKPTVSLSATTLDFSEQRVSTTSTAKSVRLTNTGGAPLIVSAISISGPFQIASTEAFTVEPTAYKDLSVTFTPATLGSASGSLVLTTDDRDRTTATIFLSGLGVRPTLELDPSSVSFGDQRVGVASAARFVKVKNVGSGTLRITSQSITGGGVFSVSPNTGFDVPQGGSLDLAVTFKPSAEGGATGALFLTTNDPVTPSTVSFSGNGVVPRLSMSPNSLDFGTQSVGAPSTQKVMVHNGGTGSVRITGISMPAGKPFSFSPSTFSVLPGGDQELSVTFNPTTKGLATTDFTLLTDEAVPTAGAVSLSGTGVSSLELDPAEQFDFSDVPKDTTVTRTIRIINTSAVAITISSITTDAPFSVVPLSSMTLASRAVATLSLRFNPTIVGPASAILTVQSDAFNSPHRLRLVGNGVVPEAQLSLPPSTASITTLPFEGVRVGATKSVTVKLTNTGKAPLIINEAPTMSAGAFTFLWTATYPLTIAGGASYDFPVSFTPASSISYSGTFTIRSNAVNGPTVLSLTGFGDYPDLRLSQTVIDFKDVRVGAESSKVAVTITNLGNAPAVLQNVLKSGDFDVVYRGEDVPGTRSIGSPFVFDVVFKPSAKGPATGSVTLVTDVGDAIPLKVDLLGNGTISEATTSVAALDFHSQRVGTKSDALAVTIRNPGQADLEISDFILPSACGITLPAGEKMPLTIRGGQQVAVYVTFTPNRLGLMEGQMEIISNAYTPAKPVTLKGIGIDGRLILMPAGTSAVDFGSVDLKSSGKQMTVTISNAGDAPLKITSLTPPENKAFSVSGLNLGTQLGVTESVSFTVTFKPEVLNFASGNVIIGSDSVTNPALYVTLQGTGVAPAVDVQPDTGVVFGKSNVGVTSTQSITITNVGLGDRQLYVANIDFADVADGPAGAARDFSVDSAVEFPVLLSKGQSQVIPLKFTPGAVGGRRAKAIVYTNDKNVDVRLQGEGTSPNLVLSSPELKDGVLEFGNVLVNSSAPSVLTLTNTGDGPLKLEKLTTLGPDAASFGVASRTLPVTLDVGASIQVAVTLTPRRSGLFTAQLVVESNDSDTPSVTVPMSGTGVHQQILLSDSSLEFGNQLINRVSSERAVRVTNSSSATAVLSELKVEGEGAAQFTLTKLTLPRPLKFNEWQDLGVRFTPVSDADVNCKLKIIFSDPPQQLEVELHGKGIQKVLSVTPASVNFGGVRAGTTAPDQMITIANQSNETIVLGAPEEIGPPGGERFTFDGASLKGRTIPPNESIIVPVGYHPTVETLSQSTLSFGTTTPLLPRSVDVVLTGRATNFLLTVDQDSLDFGWVNVNKTVDPKVITVTNKSAQPQRVLVKLKAPAGSPFALETKGLADPIPVGGSATFSVAFDPDKSGEADNTVLVSLDGRAEAEALISVKGIGRALKGEGGGCSCGSTEAGTAGLLTLLALVGLSSRRRRRE